MMTEAADMPLSGHLTELRKRLIYSFLAIAVGTAVSFFFIRELMAFLTAPAGQLYFARPTEVLMIYIKTAVVAGFVLASPVVFFEFWRFLLPALTDREKSWCCVFVPLSVILFLSGLAFSYFFVMPESLHFLMGFGGESFAAERDCADLDSGSSECAADHANSFAIFFSSPGMSIFCGQCFTQRLQLTHSEARESSGMAL